MLFFCLYKYFTLFPNRQLLGGPCSLWVDNFSKTLHRTNPTLSRDVYSSMLWTGMAVFASEKTSQLDASVQTDDHGAVIPAMPAQICQHRDQVLEGLSYVHNQGRHYLTNSLVHRFGVNNIPMAILDPEDVMQNQHPSKDHSVDIVHPYVPDGGHEHWQQHWPGVNSQATPLRSYWHGSRRMQEVRLSQRR